MQATAPSSLLAIILDPTPAEIGINRPDRQSREAASSGH